MNRSELEHIIRAAASITGESEFIIIGSQSILGKCPDAPNELRRSIEVDIFPKINPSRSIEIDGAIGEQSSFHSTYSYYAHGVGPETAILPDGWEGRLIKVSNEATKNNVGWCLDPHDLAFSKIAAGRERDLSFVNNLLKHKIIRQSRIGKLIDNCKDLNLKKILKENLKIIETSLRKQNRIKI